MTPEELAGHFNAPAGYLGPIGIEGRAASARSRGTLVILDKALEGRTNLIAGANKEEYHLRNVTPGRDFKPTLIADIRNINEGEGCPIDGSPLRLGKAVEIGHIFKLGYKYSEIHGSHRPQPRRQRGHPHHGQLRHRHRAHPHRRHRNLRRSQRRLCLCPASRHRSLPRRRHHHQHRRAALLAAGEKVAAELEAAGLDVLLDDRDERAGVKFKDADLVGIPYRINIGRGVAEGKVELVDRLQNQSNDIATE